MPEADFLQNLLAGFACELRTPLVSMYGFIGNMIDGVVGEFDEKQMRYINRLHLWCESVVRIMEDLTLISRAVTLEVKLNKSHFSLFQVISDLESNFLDEPLRKKEYP